MILVATLMGALMAVVLWFMRRHYPAHIHGIGYWAISPALWVVAALLFGNRNAGWPAALTVVLANLLLMLGAIAYLVGCQRFFKRPQRWRAWLAVAGAASLGLAWLTHVQPSYTARLIVITAVLIGIYLSNLLLLLRHGGNRLPVRLVEITLAAHIAALLVRLLTAATGLAGEEMYETSAIQIAYIGAFVVAQLFYAIGAVLMATDRLVTELEHLATCDPLTQVLNRRAVLQQCHDELLRSQRSGRGPALLMLDLDNFKAINDTHGHQHGDAVLRHFTGRVQAVLRGADRIGRYGGEEFVLLLPETGADDAMKAADRVHAALASGHALDCQLSIGLTTWQGRQDTLEHMLARADRALYQAKEQGRNRSCRA
ncbi:GGDEF domain-containing protein [Comamonas sp. NLF-1-9]|nr:GGDEF domain-containing protein [Comamonas sp. NLF-1-9]